MPLERPLPLDGQHGELGDLGGELADDGDVGRGEAGAGLDAHRRVLSVMRYATRGHQAAARSANAAAGSLPRVTFGRARMRTALTCLGPLPLRSRPTP